jgi:hypothetical protein
MSFLNIIAKMETGQRKIAEIRGDGTVIIFQSKKDNYDFLGKLARASKVMLELKRETELIRWRLDKWSTVPNYDFCNPNCTVVIWKTTPRNGAWEITWLWKE